MSRSFCMAASFTLVLAGCAPPASKSPAFFRVELPSQKEAADSDIVSASLRSEPETIIAKLPKFGEKRGLALRLKRDYARLQFQWPLLPRRMPLRLTMIARSFWQPDAIGTPRGKFLLRLGLPLSPLHRRAEPSASSMHVMDRGFLVGPPDSLVIEQGTLSMHGREDGSTDEDELFDVWLPDLDMVLPTVDRS